MTNAHAESGKTACLKIIRSAMFGHAIADTMCVLRAVNLGDDTDTVAAVAGGLAGCLYGMEGIPDGWPAGLRKARSSCRFRSEMVSKVMLQKEDI